jgi:hypothetical protein
MEHLEDCTPNLRIKECIGTLLPGALRKLARTENRSVVDPGEVFLPAKPESTLLELSDPLMRPLASSAQRNQIVSQSPIGLHAQPIPAPK